MEYRQYNNLHATDDERFRGTKRLVQDFIHSREQDRTSAQVCLTLRQLFFLL